jgi:outer membrane protein assembly factor BamD
MFPPSRSQRRAHARFALFLLLVSAAACTQAFNVTKFKDDDRALFTATMREYQLKRWDNAVAGFERLTLELPARDTLLPTSHYYLGLSYGKRKEHLLAAQAFTRLTESFPDHPLADDGLYGAARSYHRLWRKPVLDAQYGQTALSTYRLYLAMFPNGEQRATAERQVADLEQRFATKEYLNGMFYRRRKYFDSAIIYFRGVVTNYPETPRARDAWLRLAEVYREIKYSADAADACAELRKRWPDDVEVRRTCAAPATPATPAAAPAATPPVRPATTRLPAPTPPSRDGEAPRPPPVGPARP